jgi:hypothetical protein
MSSQFSSEWLKAYELRTASRSRDLARSPAVVERRADVKQVGPTPIQEANHERIIVRCCSVRKRLLDEDNMCEKFIVDALRYCGIIADDRPATTKIEVTQRKCGPGEEEHVIVEIFQ